MTAPSPDAFTPATAMGALMAAWPGARRALFARFHIGGCSACAFDPAEPLASVAARHHVDAAEVLAHLQQAHEADAALSMAPEDAARWMAGRPPPAILDLRSREEFEAVHLPGALLLSQDLREKVFASWEKSAPILLCDHRGDRALDVAAWFTGHGFTQTKALAGGIDAYARLVDPSLPRYRIELDPEPATGKNFASLPHPTGPHHTRAS